jgi:hypothetical protein
MIAGHARRAHVLLRSLVPSRLRGRVCHMCKAVWRRATRIRRCDGLLRRDSLLVPRTSAGAEPTRGARRLILQRARRFFRLVLPSQTGHWDCRGSLLDQVGCETQSDRSDASSIATDRDSRNPSFHTCELRALKKPPVCRPERFDLCRPERSRGGLILEPPGLYLPLTQPDVPNPLHSTAATA